MLTDLSALEAQEELRPCPACPDGNEWNSNGPTGRACKVCKGHAAVQLNGAAIDAAMGER